MDKREYDNAISYCVYELTVTYHNQNVPPHIGSDTMKLRKLLDCILTQNTDKLSDAMNEKIDQILQYELERKKLTLAHELPKVNKWPISLWKGDITTLNVDCIVNAANSKGLGCFVPGHGCIDNVIHSRAGPRMRDDCRTILGKNQIDPGNLILTLGYNLPCKKVFHVVGPIYNPSNPTSNSIQLIKCYLNSLNKLKDIKHHSIAFPCISTGEYGYPKNEACTIALNSVKRWLMLNANYPVHIVFNVYNDLDEKLYLDGLCKYFG
ncbi:macro domain-containing protein [Fadolivirus algeromassiliense]|jgi:O-acetyl-ADP-ribose deacetylase (regulator of RNase III)|uniref:Macro domain-containing protein n=1 Tax=Fadolivirus FV1/VV64 TaxID=3070911 RepID=A0A7D3V610_9VIRU|nr:macro domain-containing protein [Fadolivirus algeromassiliense]QKF94672.1 macro domain-containing protein [Fadolivirus FV1/VV64]